MPNKPRSGAQRRTTAKKNSSSTASSAPQASTSSNFTPTGDFTFSFASPTGKASSAGAAGESAAAGQQRNGAGSQTNGRGQPVQSSESEGSSTEEEDGDDDDQDDSASKPREIPDDELTDAQRKQRAEEKKLQGNERYKLKDYPTATRLYSHAIELDPTNPAYLTNRAASRMESRLYGPALEDLLAASALQRAAPQVKTLVRLGKCQLALGLIVPAQSTLDNAFKLDPTNGPLLNERARAARLANHVVNIKREMQGENWSMVILGIDAASREIEETPREWRVWKVQALVGKKRYDEAAAMAADLLRLDQSQPEPLYYRGLCLFYNGNHPQAIAHLQSALRNDPDFVLARTLLKKVRQLDALKDAGNDAFKAGQQDEAIGKYTEALELAEDNDTLRATLFSNRASARLKRKDYDAALSDCNACLELNESYFKVIRTRARVYLAQEQWEDAVRDFEKAYEMAPAGSADETALKGEVKDAKAKLKRSKLKDHYKILGVTTEATDIEIKKGYRKMSLMHHPDKPGGSNEKFQEVSLAYEILSDPQRRRKFDAGIDESDPTGGMDGDMMGGFGMGGFPMGGHPFGGGMGGGFNPEDLFSGGFGGGGGGGYGGRRGHSHSYGF